MSKINSGNRAILFIILIILGAIWVYAYQGLHTSIIYSLSMIVAVSVFIIGEKLQVVD